jgi:diketogulonate reductase-like aldo/keto reductase
MASCTYLSLLLLLLLHRSVAHDDPTCSKIPAVTLSNGVKMPQLMLGTAHLVFEPNTLDDNPSFTGLLPESTYRSVQLALQAGWRGFDSALIYRSHRAIGAVLGTWFAQGTLSRSDVFLTTKVFHGPVHVATADTHMPELDTMMVEQVTQAMHQQLEQSLVEVGVGYFDLILLHWPAAFESQSPDNRLRRIAAWKVLEQYYDKGWARAIGVSNFSVQHLNQLRDDGATIVPMVNQIEASVKIQWHDIVNYCKDNGIQLQAYSPLGRGLTNIANDPVVLEIASKHSKDAGQVAMRYLLQLGYALTCLSSSESRLETNLDIFSFALDDKDMTSLNALNRRDGTWGLPGPHTMA